jgi:hypothetical protein
MFSPSELDRKSLALHQLVAQKIERDPRLFGHVQKTLEFRRSQADWANQPYLARWQALVDDGMQAALSVAVEESERGQAMRQASPFAGILSNSERRSFLKSWSRNHAAA